MGEQEEQEVELMKNITFLTKEFGMGFGEIMKLPYPVFCSYIKWGQVFILEQTQEGRDLLYKESTIYKTEADLTRLRNLDGYKVIKK